MHRTMEKAIRVSWVEAPHSLVQLPSYAEALSEPPDHIEEFESSNHTTRILSLTPQSDPPPPTLQTTSINPPIHAAKQPHNRTRPNTPDLASKILGTSLLALLGLPVLLPQESDQTPSPSIFASLHSPSSSRADPHPSHPRRTSCSGRGYRTVDGREGSTVCSLGGRSGLGRPLQGRI